MKNLEQFIEKYSGKDMLQKRIRNISKKLCTALEAESFDPEEVEILNREFSRLCIKESRCGYGDKEIVGI